MEKNNFWIDVSFDGDGSLKKLESAVLALQQTHNFTIEYLNQSFLREGKRASYKNFRDHLNQFIRKEKLWRQTQRYSLERVAENSFPYFSAQVKFDSKKKFIAVKPAAVRTIQIRIRKVWKKYLARGSGLTTDYGTIFLEGEWKKTLREQAGSIPIDLFPFLWHSVTLKKFGENDWKIKFNFHSPYSRHGKNAKKELEEEYGEF